MNLLQGTSGTAGNRQHFAGRRSIACAVILRRVPVQVTAGTGRTVTYFWLDRAPKVCYDNACPNAEGPRRAAGRVRAAAEVGWRPRIICTRSLMDRTEASDAFNAGSIPVECTTEGAGEYFPGPSLLFGRLYRTGFRISFNGASCEPSAYMDICVHGFAELQVFCAIFMEVTMIRTGFLYFLPIALEFYQCDTVK